jgi:drug/metabolite transporter (DMT)-like permease
MPHRDRRAVTGLLFNALVWGLSWWPMRRLAEAGLHPLWATSLIFLLASAVIGLRAPAAWRLLARSPTLWAIAAAAGLTNAAFNWGITVGDVVRVVLLFYLMPLWTVVLARWLLGERVSRSAALRVALGLAGAAVVLWPAGGVQALAFEPADALGLVGGFTFALNNILLKRGAALPSEGRGLAMFVGGCLVSGAMALALQVPLPPSAGAWLPGTLALGALFLASNLALQYSVVRLDAHASAVIMLTEIVWASGSSWLLGAGHLDARLLAGAALILGAALLSALKP